MRRSDSFALLAGLTVLIPACGADPAPPKTADGTASSGAASQSAAPAAAQPKADSTSPSTGSLHIDSRILKACGDLPIARFAFDSASIEGDAATALRAVARCFDKGPLAGKSMKLVGHADARGGPGYNMALGEQRATSVANFLDKNGLPAARVSTMSKGALEASGVDEEGWARDRKVEMFLAD
jgi:peptidoglycan-associated lipoprotein